MQHYRKLTLAQRLKAILLAHRVKREEAIYLANPSLANLRKWSVSCSTLYKLRFLPIDTHTAQ